MGFIVEIARGATSDSIANGKVLSGSGFPLTIEEDANTVYILAGLIYGSKNEPLNEIAKKLSAPTAALNLPGRFVLAVFDKTNGSLKTWTDKYRLLGSFLICEKDRFILSNDLRICDEFFNRDLLDSRAVVDLLLFGYIQPPLTLYSNVTMLSGYSESSSENLWQLDWREHCDLTPKNKTTFMV